MRAGSRRGFTLIEVMVVTVIAAMLTAAVVTGIGAATNARLKGACTLVSSAIRSAYTRALFAAAFDIKAEAGAALNR